MRIELFEVGGCVRDELLGLKSKDIDYTVVAESWDHMLAFLDYNQFEVFLATPQYLTVRAKFPRGWSFGGRDVTDLTADFVLARKEGSYFDGRHPESVQVGTLEDDLRRRDFTVNAMAKDAEGNLIDLFGGQADLEARLLRTVGEPEDRFGEDALRALRAVRFSVTKGMTLHEAVVDALRSEWLPPLLGRVSAERRREELLRAFRHDTMATFETLFYLGSAFREAALADGLWLMPTLRK